MKKYILLLLLISGFLIIGVWYTKPTTTEKKPLYWVAPMDPTYRSDKPGKSPMGMDLIPVYAEETKMDKNIVHISPQIEQNLGVRTEEVKRQDIARQIRTVGYITADENRIDQIHTYTDGWVKNLYVKTTGDHVKKDQLLMEIYSPTLVSAQDEYLLALNSGNKILLSASHKKLLSLGVSENQIQELKKKKKSMELIKIYSTQPGIVSKLHVREGMYVTPNMNLITLEDLSHIWIIADVFERQSQWVKEGLPAEATLPYIPGKKWRGKVDYVYPQLESTTHTLKVRLHFSNPEETLKPNMYANVIVFAAPLKNVLTISRSAIIYSGEGARVILSLGEGKYTVQDVHVGIESGERIVILGGLKEGDKVVTSSQFLLDSEANLQASFERINTKKMNKKMEGHHHH